MNARRLLLIVLIMLTATQTIYVSRSEHPYKLRSAWLNNPVYLDRDITNSKEWIDVASIEINLGTNYGRSSPFLESTIWAKNDLTDLYLLYRVKFPYNSYGLDDTAFIYYLIHNSTGGYIATDKSIVQQIGAPIDLYDFDGSTWSNDEPTGINNVQGMGHYDGIFYWFELRKPLDSGDMCDWLFELGETYGYADSPIDTSDHLCLGVRCDSQGYDVQNFIQLVIAKPPIDDFTPVGGELLPVSKTEIMIYLVKKILAYITVILCCIYAAKKLL